MDGMALAEATTQFPGEDGQERPVRNQTLWGWDEPFLRALCELLEIQARRGAEAVVICPDGPETLH